VATNGLSRDLELLGRQLCDLGGMFIDIVDDELSDLGAFGTRRHQTLLADCSILDCKQNLSHLTTNSDVLVFSTPW